MRHQRFSESGIWPLLACAVIAMAPGRPRAEESGFLAQQQALLAWQERDKPGQTEQAIRIWEQALRAEPGRGALWIRLTHALGRAVRHAKSNKERRRWAGEALQAGKKAVERQPQSAAAHAAYAEALGQWAEAHKGIKSLKHVKEAVRALETAVKLDPTYAYAHMLLAEFYRQSPAMFSVGDKRKALAHAKLAVEYGPAYAINHLVLAKAHLDLGHKEEGVAGLLRVLDLPPPDDAIPETRADQATARQMLDRLGITPAAGRSGASPTSATPPPSSPASCAEAPENTCMRQP